jgi:hypothetical protein
LIGWSTVPTRTSPVVGETASSSISSVHGLSIDALVTDHEIRVERAPGVAARPVLHRIALDEAVHHQADDACMREDASARAALPRRAPWTSSRRRPARDRSRLASASVESGSDRFAIAFHATPLSRTRIDQEHGSIRCSAGALTRRRVAPWPSAGSS